MYADQSNFQAALQGKPEKMIVTEPIFWDEPYDESATAFTTDTPVEIVLGKNSITIAENSRLSFSGPFHFTGDGSLFQIGGDLFLDGADLTANGDGAGAISFSGSTVTTGAFTMNLELQDCALSVQGLDGVGVRAAQGAVIRMVNTSVICAGENSTGVISAAGSAVSIYEQSRFVVTGKNATGIVLSEQVSGFLEFDLTVKGESSLGAVVSGGDYANSGTVTVSGKRAIGVYLEENAYKAEAGKIVVTGAESTGIFAEGNLEASQLSLRAETGMAAEADGKLSFILCDIDAATTKLLSHTGEIMLDTCRASDIPFGAVVKTRKAQLYLNGDGEYFSNAYDVGTFGFSIPVGTERFTLPDKLTFSLYDAEDFTVQTIERFLPVTWVQANYDLDTIGDYVINYRADTGVLPMEISGTVMIHVYDGNRPRLNYAVRIGDDYTELYFAPQLEDEQQIRLWVSDDEGKIWRDYIAEGRAQAWGFLGFVATDELKENTTYLLKLELVGGLHSGTSPILSYWRNEREIKWSNGDRDGGDQRPQQERPQGQNPAPETPPPPTPTPERESLPAFVQHPPAKAPPSGMELTQTELQDLTEANPKTITVVSDGVKAELPTDALKNIPLEPDESLNIVLEQPEENTFSVRIYAGQREISSLEEPVTVTVPNPSGIRQAVPQTGGTPIPAEDAKEGKIAFPIPKTGTYVMDATPAGQEDPKSHDANGFAWFWLSGILLPIGIALLIVRRVLRKRRAEL